MKISHPRALLSSLILTSLIALPAHAQTPQYRIVHFLSGTGFFINREGNVVTNAHVLQNCKRITVLGAVPETEATLKDKDEKHDLALLKTTANPPDVAELRDPSFPAVKDERVVIVGFPGERGLTTDESLVIDPYGPQGEKEWLQFADSVGKGNSGGPLLDESGNVLGVVRAKAQLFTHNAEAGRDDLLSKSDIAVSLPTLRRFLDDSWVRYRTSLRQSPLAAHRVEDRAREFVVNVRCWQEK